MWISTRCEVCDLAFTMGKSEDQFYREFDPWERAQLLATYRSMEKRKRVVMDFPARGEG
jgi:hypothetical protein